MLSILRREDANRGNCGACRCEIIWTAVIVDAGGARRNEHPTGLNRAVSRNRRKTRVYAADLTKNLGTPPLLDCSDLIVDGSMKASARQQWRI